MSNVPHQDASTPVRPAGKTAWRVLLGVCLVLLALLLIAVPFLASGSELWLGIDWIDGRKLFSIDDAYRYFIGKNAFQLQTVFIWNFVMPAALLFDAITSAVTDGSLLGMRLFHAGVGALTILIVARASLRSGCGTALAIASVLIVGLMPLYLIVSSSFYGEGLFAFLVAVAFLLLIEERGKLLAVVVGLLPLVRPEGAIYSISFLVYFGMRRDVKSCVLVVLPGLVYLAALLMFSTDPVASVTWRLELRKILTPLDPYTVREMSPDRLSALLWASLALASPFILRWRKWWPILVGPWCLVAIQAIAVVRGVQGFEPRYYFSAIPIFAVAWAFPIRSILDASATRPLRRRLVITATTAASLIIVALNLFQSDWVRQYYADAELPAVGRDFQARALWFDPRPMRAFARRVDAFIRTHDEVETVFIATSAPLYFLEFLHDRPGIELILIPHNPVVANYSGGYFFGFSLEQLAYRYYKFDPGDATNHAPAVLIVDDARQDPFDFALPGELPEGTTKFSSPRRVTANVQSGSLKAFAVNFDSQESANWIFPSPRQEK